MRKRIKNATPRWLALVAIGSVAIGSYAIAPAIGGPGNLSLKKAKRHFFTKKQTNNRYFTKAQTNNRFYTRPVANARFVPRQSGEHSATLDPHDWEPGSGLAPGSRSLATGLVSFTDNDAGNVATLHAGSLPHQFAGKGLRLAAVEVCFRLDDATITNFRVIRSGTGGSGNPIAAPVTYIDDSTTLDSDACHRYSAPPAPVGGAAVIDLELTVSFAGGGGQIDIGRTLPIFVP